MKIERLFDIVNIKFDRGRVIESKDGSCAIAILNKEEIMELSEWINNNKPWFEGRDYERDMRRVAKFVLTNICCYIEKYGIENLIFEGVTTEDDVNDIFMKVADGRHGMDMHMYSDVDRNYGRELLNDLPKWIMKNVVEEEKRDE